MVRFTIDLRFDHHCKIEASKVAEFLDSQKPDDATRILNRFFTEQPLQDSAMKVAGGLIYTQIADEVEEVIDSVASKVPSHSKQQHITTSLYQHDQHLIGVAKMKMHHRKRLITLGHSIFANDSQQGLRFGEEVLLGTTNISMDVALLRAIETSRQLGRDTYGISDWFAETYDHIQQNIDDSYKKFL